jgi:hypothetical protein
MSTLSSGNCGGGGDVGHRDIIKYFGNFNGMEMLNKTSGLPPMVLIRSSIMSHITLKMCQFVLKLHQKRYYAPFMGYKFIAYLCP